MTKQKNSEDINFEKIKKTKKSFVGSPDKSKKVKEEKERKLKRRLKNSW
jgi:hypothetical protein